MADEDREDAYDPSVAEVDRGRMQGLGVGARDLARQDDPHRLAQGRSDAGAGESRPAGPPGKPEEAYDARDADEVSFTQGSGGAGVS